MLLSSRAMARAAKKMISPTTRALAKVSIMELPSIIRMGV